MTYPQTTIVLNGKTITIETGRFGAQASGSVTVRCGDTIVIASCVASNKVKEGIDYFPLSIDYQEKLYAGGVISSSRFIKREGRPSEGEILTGRVIDRSIRPLFDQASRNEVQLLSSPLSIDGVEEPEILSIIAASAAVSLSDYPWLNELVLENHRHKYPRWHCFQKEICLFLRHSSILRFLFLSLKTDVFAPISQDPCHVWFGKDR